MNHTVIPIAVKSASKERKRQAPKGRRVDPSALAEVQALLGVESRQADLLNELSIVMRDGSICGLGQAAPNPVDCVVKYFPHELA